MGRDRTERRWVVAQSIAFGGFRWHTRSLCLSGEYFKDFVQSRVPKIHGSRGSDTSANNHSDWNSQVTLEVGPHPDLTETQAKVLAFDYGMRGGKAKIKVRRALLYYALMRLGLDPDPAARRPQDQPIVLLNHNAIFDGGDGSAAQSPGQ